ncbi:MAG: hypothetical protein ABSH06_14970 [Thermodesulfobacteriota bacterium]
MSLKEKVETLKAGFGIVAILVAGFWTYYHFIMERRNFPHANIEQKISHISLSKNINLLRLNIELTNTGNARLVSHRSIARIQQILPILSCKENDPCSVKQVNAALKETQRKENRFSWPLVAERETIFKPALEIEPNEKDIIDFEFAVPSSIKVLRVYSYFRNDKKTKGDKNEIGWSVSNYYDFRKASKEGGK